MFLDKPQGRVDRTYCHPNNCYKNPPKTCVTNAVPIYLLSSKEVGFRMTERIRRDLSV